MQIPEHWAEARLVGKVNGRDRVVRRYGWSVASAAEAERMAQQRAAAALAELQAGRQVAQREQKLPYGGDGLPIREQVLARHGDLVVTRNSYGARCLNAPDVLFADIDFDHELPPWLERLFRMLPWALLTCVAGFGFPLAWQRGGVTAANLSVGILALALGHLLLRITAHVLRTAPANARDRAHTLARVRAVLADLPDGRCALYATPAGLRAIVLHACSDPRSEWTRTLFRNLGGDPAYTSLCALQSCFRARISAKPWRIGVRKIKPRPGIWPVHPDRRVDRERWVAEYEAAAAGFAACRFLEDLGTGPVHPRCAEVQRLHDELSGARSGKPIA